MKKIILLIFISLVSITSYGQVLDDTELTGKWNVDKIIKKPTNPQFKPLIDGFEKSTFNFKKNNDFELITTNNSELFKMLITDVLNGAKWKYIIDKQLIKIGTKEDGYTAMGVFVKKENGSLLFHLDESGLTFLMKKSK